jgi:glycosyltransferase involved in cell wall biosynthesis
VAGPRQELVGWVDGAEKRELLAGAKALLHNCRAEDFGIVPIEALASGTPVLTVAEGMPQHTVPDGAGHTYPAGELASAIDRFEREGVAWAPDRMARWAATNFSEQRFIRQMRDAIDAARERHRINPDLQPAEAAAVADGGGGGE